MKVLSLLVIFSLLLPLSSQAQWNLFGASKKVDLKCENLRDIKKGFLIAHINTSKMTPTLEARTVKQHLESLDPMKIFFSQSDINMLTKKMKNIYKQIDKGNCKTLFEVKEHYTKRVKDRVKFAKSKLNKKFKFDKSVTIMLDPDKRGYAKNDKELEKLQEDYIHFQVSNRLITGKKTQEAVDLVRRSYDRSVRKLEKFRDSDVLVGYLNSFAHSLDPHTSYFSADMLEDFEIQMSLSLEGIGATLTPEDGFTVVDSLVKGGAAERSGKIFPKDKIIAVGQFKKGRPQAFENVVEWDLRDVVRLIRGKKGSKVRLKILRQNKGKTDHHTVTLVRDKIKLEDDAAKLSVIDKEVNGVKRKVGIINLPSFYAGSRKGDRSSARDVKNIIKDAKKKNVDGLILDMSNNGGGSLSDAVQLAGLFFKTGNVVKQSSKNPRLKPIPLKDDDEEVDWTGPLVVLTSRVSASASEIVAGTLKDYDRAVVVGADHTFGKGSVQQVIPLAPGLGALKVTVGMVFTPGGFSTQHRGVESHIVLPSALDEKEIGEKTLDYSLPPKKIGQFISKDAFVTSGKSKWQKVAKKTIQTLAKRSKARVSKDKEFKEIVEELKKAKEEEKKGLVLGESFEERKDKNEEYEKKKELTKAEELEEYHKRPDVREAINVLVDLVDIQSKVPLKLAKDLKDMDGV
ncbi:MAG: carboxy terminal-processing peptidase [Bdellovibrionales bacterium]|nr:carboxy terminal-processing peptidase [Bdellovibrionales bacterium]NQZ18472.1 carboxy terminal-processing peptidase [Bdellovibrionales bacterium]